MLHYLEVGGPILWVLVVISIGAFAVVLERIVFFARNEKNIGDTFKDEILSLVANKKIDEAIALCNTKKSCVASAVKKFLQKAPKGIDVQDYEFILKEITIKETSPYESRLNLLASVISISPMLGLLGTVTGMIRAFTNISKYGAGDAAIVADGIAEALLTTAAGLMIAIPVIVIYNYLNRRLEKMENEIDDVVTNIINIFRR
ncbi:MotA/TolQ/ExbB proton channel family protein [Fusobacterium vincentii]|uniref:MotA/TolQ/ExbB proton channel family protein n=1 Tax=Fusobacterium vincentii TaxID=155615 RepID=UPI000C1C7A5A|nr:MotA/TolQ/ExbB proton channel family protein [Fusobacterium vincentii]ATV05976.1 MotA/TolQ/ExbB proton channel family protein [Fusobacterium vincentii]